MTTYDVKMVDGERFQVDEATRATLVDPGKQSSLVETTIMKAGKWVPGPTVNVAHVVSIREHHASEPFFIAISPRR